MPDISLDLRRESDLVNLIGRNKSMSNVNIQQTLQPTNVRFRSVSVYTTTLEFLLLLFLINPNLVVLLNKKQLTTINNNFELRLDA